MLSNLLLIYVVLNCSASVPTSIMDYSPLEIFEERTVGKLLFMSMFGPGIFVGKILAKILRKKV